MVSQALSQQPTRLNGYRATSQTRLDWNVWNASVGDLALRMAAVEEKATGYQTIVDTGIGIALERINDALIPAALQVQTIIDQTNTYLLQLQGNAIAASLVTTDSTRRFVTDDQILDINTIDAVTARVTSLESNGSQASARLYYLATM